MKRLILPAVVAAALVAGGCTAADELAGNCVQNAFGAEFCGEDGRNYCREFGGPACADVYGMSTKGEVQRDLEEAERQFEVEMDQAEREMDAALEDLSNGCYEEYC